ncbi:MAG: hypothetical protein QXK47_03805 [Candidatus Bathyarchaeia archaeon]
MTRLTPLLTNLKTLDITYSKQETLLDTPETLPTSEPATPQIGYTVQNSDLPVLSFPPYKKVWVAFLLGAGKFPTAGTIYWRMKKNGANVASSSTSVSTNYYYTVCCFFNNVAVDDVLELALWSSVNGNNWDYKAFQIQVSRIIPTNKPRLLMPCAFTSLATHPQLTLGNPSSSVTNLYIYHLDKNIGNINTATTYECMYPKDTYGLCQIYYGDNYLPNSATVRTSSTYRPYYYRNYVPAQIRFRGVKID